MSHTILAIDDHPDTVRLIEMALERHGYHVIGTCSGKEGLELARETRPDLIVLDMMMPGMDGIDVCRQIREDSDLGDTPIIMFTAKAQAHDKKHSFDIGADDYLTKPARPADLLERVQALLSRREPPADAGSRHDAADPTARQGPWFVNVVGTRGGAGATTVALNLAITLANQSHETTLVDLDTQQGHVALYLGHDEPPDLVEWLNLPAGHLDDAIHRYLVRHQDGLELLLTKGHLNPDEGRLRASQVAALLTILRATGRSLVVDVGKQLGAATGALFQQSSCTILCLRPERASILSARQIVEHLSQLSAHNPILAIMLDFGNAENLPRASVEDFLGFDLAEVMSLDPKQVAQSANRGQPLVHAKQNGQAARQFEQLARRVMETPVP